MKTWIKVVILMVATIGVGVIVWYTWPKFKSWWDERNAEKTTVVEGTVAPQ